MKKKKIINVILAVVAFTIVIIELFPIGIIIMNGFKTDMDIWTTTNPFIFRPTLNSYRSILNNRAFTRSIINSFIVAFLSTGFSVIVGSMASYGLTRYVFKGRKFFSYSFLTSRMIPQISLAIPLYLVFLNIGAIDTRWGLSLSHISFNVPYVMWLLLPFFASIPKEFEEAAKVDGCSDKKIFWLIFMPLVAPGLVVSAVFAFIMSWNEFIYALILTSTSARTAPVSVNAFLGQYAPQWGQLSAAGTLMLLPAFLITLLLQKYIIQGLTAGGVKG